MTQYAIRRILYSIPVIFGILVVTFIMARAIPGDPCKAMLGEKASAEVCERFNREQGLDKPIPVQFGVYMKNIFSGDFGDSIRYSRPVAKILLERLPTTIELGLIALILAIMVGIPAGVIAAVRRNTAVDVGVMIAANTGVSMPVYWLGLLLAYLFALVLKDTPFWLPPSGRISAGLSATPFFEVFQWGIVEGSGIYNFLEFFANMYIFNSIISGNWEVLGDVIKHLILPAVALSTIPLAIIARMTRSSMLEVLRQDYIRTARAKGLFERFVILKHAFRNALLPVITIIGLQVGTLFAGAVLTETIFGFAGVGRMLFEAITARDFPIVQGFTVVIAVGYVAVNLLVDLSYVFIDPRIRLD
ncbi:MAG: ABC transporter permease [Anaerolineales bacterium]|uniref:ABC transporter permease n=1 Tax=Candidatus Desulfolinea nitratireducens TaxID=2841698 RepID=A0A8J6NL26_9CHLR|nr:ABC transporter permease [Candidatus Desulfolinea nitratireducens]MBL6961731.1 ABC transporter permease [Anaerolineales bacterium]